jgi:hypothetical protein
MVQVLDRRLRRPRRALRAATLPIALLAAAPHATPRQSEVIDGGAFTLYQRGTRIGEERFVVRADQAGADGPLYRAGAELNLKLDGQTLRASVALEALGPSARPRRYEAELNGSAATSIVATFMRDRVRLESRSPEGQEMKELLVRDAKALILDRYVAHHYFFVAEVLGDSSSATAAALLPQEHEVESVTIEDGGPETVRLGDRELTLRHLTVRPASGLSRHVWLDGRRVIKVEVPAEEFVALRTGSGSQ